MVAAVYTYDPAGVYRSSGGVAPWARLFAKNYDLAFYSIGLFVIWFSLFGFEADEIDLYILSVLSLVFFPLFESLSQYLFGNSIGKRLLGLRIVASDGSDVSFAELLKRNYRCYLQGLALGIPLISIITYIWGYVSYTHRGMSSWDRETRTKCATLHASAWRTVIVGGFPFWMSLFAVAIITIVGVTGSNLTTTFNEVSEGLNCYNC